MEKRDYKYLFLSFLGYYVFMTCESREFRIAWMAPTREYYNLSAATSVGGLKLALMALQSDGEDTPLSGHKVRWVIIRSQYSFAEFIKINHKFNY